MTEIQAGRPTIVVSACLLGTCCNHQGRGSPSPAVIALGQTSHLVPVCPETIGGLPTPRPAAEILGDRVVTKSGADVTEAYQRGAQATVDLARAVGADLAILKARSPSCGPGEVYDGSFTRTLVSGGGVTAEALRRAGVSVRSDEEI